MGLVLALPVTWSHLVWEWGRLRRVLALHQGEGFTWNSVCKAVGGCTQERQDRAHPQVFPSPGSVSILHCCLLGCSCAFGHILRGRRDWGSNRKLIQSSYGFGGNHRGNLALHKAARLGSMRCSHLGWGQELDFPLPTPVSRELTFICHWGIRWWLMAQVLLPEVRQVL